MESDSDNPRGEWTAVLHRWFVQYNPLYLVSATLVLTGVVLLMQATAGRGGLFGQLSSTVVSELYAWALIGSAALLVRRGLWRPAVMLALLVALYQCDPTLSTERALYLDAAGIVASGMWLVGFAAKLRALAWAMQLRLSSAARGVAGFGAAVVVGTPWMLAMLPGRAASLLVGVLVFATFVAGLWTPRQTQPWVQRSPWAQVVAGRAERAVWTGWGAALVFHVWFSALQGPGMQLSVFVPCVLVLALRRIRTERWVWAWSSGTLVLVAGLDPGLFAVTALMLAVMLALRAFRSPTRVGGRVVLEPVPAQTRTRLLVGAWAALYLAVWTATWRSGFWPVHDGLLDAAFVSVSVHWAWRRRAGVVLVPPACVVAHLLISQRMVSAPQTPLQWSLAAIAVGFALLMAGLRVSFRSAAETESP